MDSIKSALSDLCSNYKDWVRRNPQKASEAETTIKLLSYFIAGKINKSVILTELVYSASNLLALFNDIIIESGKQKVKSSGEKIKIWLSVLEYSEVFIEISSKSLWGEKGKWLVICCVQLLKCTARLTLLFQFKEKIISCPPILPLKRSQDREGGGKNTDGMPKVNNIAFSLKKSGRVIRKVDTAPPLNSRSWKPPVLTTVNNTCNEEMNKKVLQKQLIGEMLYIIKPVVNLGVMLKSGRTTWKPWMVSALLDVISLYLLSFSKTRTDRRLPITNEARELSRRHLALLLYLMRSPFYERHSKNRIDAFLKSMSKNIPLIRFLCDPIRQYLPHWQETYFYLWSS